MDEWAKTLDSMLKNDKLLEQYSKYNFDYVRANYDKSNMNSKIWKLINSL